MKVFIENYRGFDIEFDTSYEKFHCIVTEEQTKESVSFKAVKKFIDDYKKENANFTPFFIELHPQRYIFKDAKYMKVVGMRKDGKFVCEDEEGKKEQISTYNETDWVVKKDKNQPYFQKLRELKEKEDAQIAESKKMREEIMSKMDFVSLKDYRNDL